MAIKLPFSTYNPEINSSQVFLISIISSFAVPPSLSIPFLSPCFSLSLLPGSFLSAFPYLQIWQITTNEFFTCAVRWWTRLSHLHYVVRPWNCSVCVRGRKQCPLSYARWKNVFLWTSDNVAPVAMGPPTEVVAIAGFSCNGFSFDLLTRASRSSLPFWFNLLEWE